MSAFALKADISVIGLDEVLDEKFSKNSRKYTLGRGEGRVYTAIVSGYPNWPIGGCSSQPALKAFCLNIRGQSYPAFTTATPHVTA